MTEQDIIDLWKQGLSKNKLAKIYRRRYNHLLNILRTNIKNRHSGKFISNYEALAIVEQVIYNYILNNKY